MKELKNMKKEDMFLNIMNKKEECIERKDY